jgi:F-type H+-transporting ATPase subunit b
MPSAVFLAESQLIEPNLASSLWILGIFLCVAIVLYKSAWKNVLAGLKAREERIRKDIADAEAARVKSEQTLGQYNTQLATAEQKVRDLLAQAAADAQKIADNIRSRAQSESEEIKERANKEIEAAKQGALREIYDQTANLATAVAEKIIRRNLNADDQRDLVTQSLDQLSSGRN